MTLLGKFLQHSEAGVDGRQGQCLQWWCSHVRVVQWENRYDDLLFEFVLPNGSSLNLALWKEYCSIT